MLLADIGLIGILLIIVIVVLLLGAFGYRRY